MKTVFIITLLTLTSIISGCATIVADDNDEVKVLTNKTTSFEAEVNGQVISVPSTVTVKRDGTDLTITTTEEGCEPNTKIDKKMDTAFLGNIITGGVFGSTTDSATGKMWDYQSEVTVICK